MEIYFYLQAVSADISPNRSGRGEGGKIYRRRDATRTAKVVSIRREEGAVKRLRGRGGFTVATASALLGRL